MRIVLLGAPGAGKGTVARLLSSRSGAPQISTGDILRGAVESGSPLGRKAAVYMDRGDLVPDDLILGLVEERLRGRDCEKGFLLDGFPRTIPQAEALGGILERIGAGLDLAVNLEVHRQLLIQRLTTRRTCSNPDCQEIFNLITKPPAGGGKCTECGAPVVQRSDETESAIATRLDTYLAKSAPLIGFYEELGILFTSRSVTKEDSLRDITGALERAGGASS